jgi:hypothetical protein
MATLRGAKNRSRLGNPWFVSAPEFEKIVGVI